MTPVSILSYKIVGQGNFLLSYYAMKDCFFYASEYWLHINYDVPYHCSSLIFREDCGNEGGEYPNFPACFKCIKLHYNFFNKESIYESK